MKSRNETTLSAAGIIMTGILLFLAGILSVILIRNRIARAVILFLHMILCHESGHALMLLALHGRIRSVSLFHVTAEQAETRWHIRFGSRSSVLGQVTADLSRIPSGKLFSPQMPRTVLLFLLGGPLVNVLGLIAGIFVRLSGDKATGLILVCIHAAALLFCTGKTALAVGDLRAVYDLGIRQDDCFYALLLLGWCSEDAGCCDPDGLLARIAGQLVSMKPSCYKTRLYQALMDRELQREQANFPEETIEFLKNRYAEDTSPQALVNRCLLGALLVKYQDICTAEAICASVCETYGGTDAAERLKNTIRRGRNAFLHTEET